MNNLGARIRAERKARRLSLEVVAARAGLTPSFLSQVERGISSPSMTSLTMIAKAFGIDVPSVLSPAVAEVEVSRETTRAVFGPNRKIRYERLSTPVEGGKLTAVKVSKAPGYASEISAHEGEEFIYVLHGNIVVSVDGQDHDLGPGDTIHYPSRLPHGVSNRTSLIAKYIIVVTVDVFGPMTALAQAIGAEPFEELTGKVDPPTEP